MYYATANQAKIKENIVNCIAKNNAKPAIKWFHLVTGHTGENRLEMTLKSRFHHPELRQ